PARAGRRHFKLMFDWTFVNVEAKGPLPELPADIRQRVQTNLLDAEGLSDLLPSDRFVLRGFTIIKAGETTDQEVLSALKRDLIDRESIVSKERFCGVEGRLRTLFRRPNLKLGIGAIEGERVLILNDFSSHEHSCIFPDSAHHNVSEFAGTIYARVVESGRPMIVHDLAAMPNRTPVEDSVLASGVRTLIVAPLHYQDRVIGTLELGSPTPNDLDSTHLPKLNEVVPLFAMAVRRSMDEFNARVQTAVKERFTAIHPVDDGRSAARCSTAWRSRAVPPRRSCGRSSSKTCIRCTRSRTSEDPRCSASARSRRTCSRSSLSRARSWTSPTRHAGSPRWTSSGIASSGTPTRSAKAWPRAMRRASSPSCAPTWSRCSTTSAPSAKPCAAPSRPIAVRSIHASARCTASAACSRRASRASRTRSRRTSISKKKRRKTSIRTTSRSRRRTASIIRSTSALRWWRTAASIPSTSRACASGS